MIARTLLAGLLILPAACIEEPTPKEAETAVQAIEEDQVKAQQLSIEGAAEEATKLIEADAREEAAAASAETEAQ
jgi:hypothetical protein